MKTKLSYEVVRNFDGVITDKGAILEVTLAKNETAETAYNFIEILNNESGYNFYNGEWDNNYYIVGWIIMDREDYSVLLDDYRQSKKKFKTING